MKRNWRLSWYRATHRLIDGKRWLLIIGPDINNRDYGFTFCRGPLRPRDDWRRWAVEWRVNIRWPLSIRRRVSA